MPVRKRRNKAFSLGGFTIEPGENRYIELPLPALYTHSNVFMPVHVTVGRESGPVMFISAALHGDEINGVEIIREILLKTLDEEGYHVDAVETGEDALKALDSQLYDLVLLDLNLPGMHGLNVLAAAPAVPGILTRMAGIPAPMRAAQ